MNPLLLKLPERIETDRLVMRPLQHSDSKAMYAAVSESSKTLHKSYSGRIAKKRVSLKEIQLYIQERIIKWHERSYINFGMFEKKTGMLIGSVSLHTFDWTVPRGRIGYWTRKNQVNKGYATEASNAITRYSFDVLKLKRFEMWSNNEISAKIPQKLGFKFIGTLEKEMTSDTGDIWDLNLYLRFNAKGLPKLNVKW